MDYPKKITPGFILLIKPKPGDPEIPLSQRRIIAELTSERAEDAVAEARELGLHGHVLRFVAEV